MNGIDLVVRPGKYLTTDGPSGSGRSTLVKLLLGLYPPTEGDVLLDGIPAAPELWRTLRRCVGVVSQEKLLLSETIADNIAFFDPELDMARAQAAAIAAHVDADILRLPMRFLSLVGDMCSALSGGQKQRVLLARALYRAINTVALWAGGQARG